MRTGTTTTVSNEYTNAKDETSKAIAALAIARRKATTDNAWAWASTAARHAVALGIREAGTLLGTGAYPEVDALEDAVLGIKFATILIVTRHAGLVDWLDRRGIIGQVLERATPSDVLGKHVIGVLPWQLAAITASYSRIAIPGCPHDRRQDDLSADELDEYGAFLRTYTVKEIEALS